MARGAVTAGVTGTGDSRPACARPYGILRTVSPFWSPANRARAAERAPHAPMPHSCGAAGGADLVMAEAKFEPDGEALRLCRGCGRKGTLRAPESPLTAWDCAGPESKADRDTFITEVDGQGEVALMNGRKRDLEDIANDLMMLLDTSKVGSA